jgi:hypothetical protein
MTAERWRLEEHRHGIAGCLARDRSLSERQWSTGRENQDNHGEDVKECWSAGRPGVGWRSVRDP